ncbi:HNH endonuclease signature motif containing protein, partial [Arthrobacter sp. KK5.5]|uniref:HNH endonuclease signature motif containing protein n=1 Tax=Arthrobacter sp. KK5.5 TaxID=3373084 RepID=UPI003EE5CE11
DGTAIVAMGRARYRPTEPMRRMLTARDPYCTHIGCARVDSENDHITEWQDGGTTDLDNLAPRCPKHHKMKTVGLWQTLTTGNGSITHTS